MNQPIHDNTSVLASLSGLLSTLLGMASGIITVTAGDITKAILLSAIGTLVGYTIGKALKWLERKLK
jgi:hypothetical protein